MLEKFQQDMIKAMKEKNKEELSVLRMAKGAMDKIRIDQKKEVDDQLLIEVIAKEIKSRNDSIAEFKKGGREDLVSKTKNEINILKRYLPEQLSEEEVDKIIDEAFVELAPQGMKDMGKVMSMVSPKVKGCFDMGVVSSKIKSRLS
ncbi:MAG: GatB/YqeY domain-containing protein [Clostridium sp.]|nr:GatB/YqeY domain-containing protein [Clostridium sp.]